MTDFDLPPDARLNYLNRRMAELASLKQHFDSDNLDEIYSTAKKMGHQIRGNAASFGFAQLTVLAEGLEQAGLAESKKEVEAFMLRLHDNVQELLRHLN